jgi:hypothetical protein
MTTLATRTASTPAVIEGRFVETAPPAPCPPMPPTKVSPAIAAGQRTYVRNPHRTPTRIAAVLLLGTAAGSLLHVHDTTGGKVAYAVALFLAVAVFLTCLIRFNACAEAGDR